MLSRYRDRQIDIHRERNIVKRQVDIIDIEKTPNVY